MQESSVASDQFSTYIFWEKVQSNKLKNNLFPRTLKLSLKTASFGPAIRSLAYVCLKRLLSRKHMINNNIKSFMPLLAG